MRTTLAFEDDDRSEQLRRDAAEMRDKFNSLLDALRAKGIVS
ncbi:hypothetical protein [Streptosporangium sp. CA-115845]